MPPIESVSVRVAPLTRSVSTAGWDRGWPLAASRHPRHASRHRLAGPTFRARTRGPVKNVGMAIAVELILARQLASGLTVPVLLVDARGDTLFYNEPAEVIFGRSFDEITALPFEE